MIATGTPTVLPLMGARPIDLKGSMPDAQMVIWYPGTQGDSAVANLLRTAARPVRMLKGFERVALAADKTRTLNFILGPNEL